MIKISSITGKNRVVIEKVGPQIDGGRYPAKRAVGETVSVQAHIFGDGHDIIRAEVIYKKKGAIKWQIIPMTLNGNDEWSGSFVIDEEKNYEFSVRAWVDHFATWYEGLIKKLEDNQYVGVELLEGAAFLKTVEKNHQQSKKHGIDEIISLFEEKIRYDEAVELAFALSFSDLVEKFPLKENITDYNKKLIISVEPSRVLFTTWYELFPRSSSRKSLRSGSFKDVEALLPRISKMNFDILYLPPIHPIGVSFRKGKNNNVKVKKGEPGSPWAIGSRDGGHKSIHKELGTLRDYKQLIRKARSLKIDLALDLAYQCSPDHPYVNQHPEWFKWRPDNTIKYAENPPKKYQDIIPFDFECNNWKELWVELKSVVDFWIKQGIRVFRVDNPHTKPLKFWEWMLAEVRKDHPEIIFLAEAFTRPKIMANLAKAGFHQSYTYFTWRVSKSEIMEYMGDLANTESRDYLRPNFWPNTPDILPYHLQNSGENHFIIRYILAATLSSNYGLYGPVFEYYENKPFDEKEEYLNSEKFEIRHHDWSRITRLTEIISIVNGARKENKALQSTWNIHFCEIDNDELLIYLKCTEDLKSIIVVAVNLDSENLQSGFVRIPKQLLGLGDKINLKLHDLISGDHYTWTNEWNYIQIDPHQLPFHLFKVEVSESQM